MQWGHRPAESGRVRSLVACTHKRAPALLQFRNAERSQGLTRPGTQPAPAESGLGLRGRGGGCLLPWQPAGEFILRGRCPIDSCTHIMHNTPSTNAVSVYS